jgi:hypothetical protein
MKFAHSLPGSLAVICLSASFSTIIAHTWVEELRLVASNGTFVGAPGYMRGYAGRTQGVDPDAQNVYILPPNGRPTGNAILSTDLICKSTQQIGVQAPGYPTLTAAPQDQIALTYYENGHVTIPKTQNGKPAGRGTVFVYGTKSPANTDTYIGIHRVWNTEGTGGDKRGKLIAVQPFDDGRCLQAQPVSSESPINLQRKQAINYPDSTELPCQTDVQIPDDAGTSGTYTLYWVWEWPTLYSNGAVMTNESYTSCMDISLTSNPVASAGKFVAAQVSGLPAQFAAISGAFATPFLVNPTALPSTASDNVNTLPVPQGVEAPTQAPAAPAAAPAAATSVAAAASPSAPASTTKPSSGFMTVTVTENSVKTVTVTEMVPIASSKAPTSQSRSQSQSQSQSVIISFSTETLVPVPSSSTITSSISSIQTSAIAVVSKPSGMYTTATTTPAVSPFLNATAAKRTLGVRGRSVRV